MPTETKPSTRETILSMLVEDRMLHAKTKHADFIRHILANGFVGFNNMSITQLSEYFRDSRFDLEDGADWWLHLMQQEEAAKLPPAPAPVETSPGYTVVTTDPKHALAHEIRKFFQNEASPALVKVMIETLGPLASTVTPQTNYEGLNALSTAQLRRLVPVSFALRDNIRHLLSLLEGDA